MKWKSLYRSYKNAKDRGTGSSTSKFLYMEEMDSIFHDNPSVQTDNVVSVGLETNLTPAINISMVQETVEETRNLEE